MFRFASWLRQGSRRFQRPVMPRASTRLAVEALEDRNLMSGTAIALNPNPSVSFNATSGVVDIIGSLWDDAVYANVGVDWFTGQSTLVINVNGQASLRTVIPLEKSVNGQLVPNILSIHFYGRDGNDQF